MTVRIHATKSLALKKEEEIEGTCTVNKIFSIESAEMERSFKCIRKNVEASIEPLRHPH